MATPTASQVQIWDQNFFRSYVRSTPFSPYMGRANREGARMPILLNRELVGGGKTVNMPFIGELEGDGVQGSNRLKGNEEELALYNQALTVNWNRHAVGIKKPDEVFTGLALRDEGKIGLRTWATKGLRLDLVCGFMAFHAKSILKGKDADNPSGKALSPLEAYLATPEPVKDAWLAANSDRFLFGGALSNHGTNDHSTSLANVDTGADRLSVDMIDLAREVAESTANGTGPGINPFMVDEDEGRQQWVLFVGVRGFRDLEKDPEMREAQLHAATRGADNPLFRSGDLVWHDTIIRKVPDIPVLAGVGAAGSDVAPAFFCGGGAVGVAWGQEPRSRTNEEDDYDFEHNVAIEESRAVAKLARGNIQHGMVTLYHSAPATV